MKKKLLLGVVVVGVIVVVSIFISRINYKDIFTTGNDSSEQTSYESEADILENLPLDENAYLNGKFYSSAFYATSQSLRLVDAEGKEYSPVAERALTENGELSGETDGENLETDAEKNLIFCFDVPDGTLGELETEKVVLYGLIYYVDAKGNVQYPNQNECFYFSTEKNGTSYSYNCEMEDILAVENGETFIEQCKQWLLDVRQNGTVISEPAGTSYQDIFTYEIDYPDYFEIAAYGEERYDCFRWPVGTREVTLRERKDGSYEVIETRKYYLDADFLENTTSYDADLLKEKAAELFVDANSSVGETLNKALTMDISSFEPVVDETVIYLVDEVPEDLLDLITEMQEELS